MSEEREGYDPPPRLYGLASWLAAEVARKGQRLVLEGLAVEGARKPHFSVLTSLSEQGAASQADLGRRLSIDRSDLHALLNELEHDGFVARVRDEQDRRRNHVTLTASGAQTLALLDKRIDAAQRELLKPLAKTEQRELLHLLHKLV